MTADTPTPTPPRSEPGLPERSSNRAILRRWARTITPWVLLALGMWWIGTSIQGDRMPSGPAPALSVQMSDGTPFVLGDQAGKVVVLNFWAAWCPPCRAEAPALRRVAEHLEHENGMMLGLAVDTISIPRARRLGMPYPQALVTQDDLDRYHVQMLPTTVVVGHDGQIIRSFVGEVEETELREVVDDALAESRRYASR